MLNVKLIEVGPIGTGCYIVWNEESVAAVIDPGDEPDRISALLSSLGLTAGAILLTHGHFDHVAAVDALSAGIPVYINALDEEMLTDPGKNGSVYFGTPPVTVLSKPTVFSDGDVVTVGSLSFTVVHTPGHTKGSSVFFIDDLVFSGDTIFAGGYGRTDLYGGSFPELKQSIRRLIPLIEGKTLYPGHGPSAKL